MALIFDTVVLFQVSMPCPIHDEYDMNQYDMGRHHLWNIHAYYVGVSKLTDFCPIIRDPPLSLNIKMFL